MAKLRAHIEASEAIQRHEAGESLRSLARAYGVGVHTLSRHIRRAGGRVRTKQQATILENTNRPQGEGSRGGRGKTAWKEDRAYHNRAIRHSRRKRVELVRRYRNERGCEDCGEKHPATLDLHHVDPATKSPRLGSIKGSRRRPRSWQHLSVADIEAELQKCVVLCSNCHRIREAEAKAKEVAQTPKE